MNRRQARKIEKRINAGANYRESTHQAALRKLYPLRLIDASWASPSAPISRQIFEIRKMIDRQILTSLRIPPGALQ